MKKFELKFEEIENDYKDDEPKWYVIRPYEKGTPCTEVGTDHIWIGSIRIGSITSDFMFIPEFIEGKAKFFSIQELQEIINFCKRQIMVK